VKGSILIAMFGLYYSSIASAAPVYLDFQDPALARQIAWTSNIHLDVGNYISNGCVACNRTNYVLVGYSSSTAINFGYAPGYINNYKKVTFLLGEWYAPDQAGPNASSINLT